MFILYSMRYRRIKFDSKPRKETTITILSHTNGGNMTQCINIQ